MCDINMSNQVKVSVLMTVFNTNFTYTKRAIDSVLKQDFTNFELIIIDNHSSDGSKEFFIEKGATVIANQANYSYPFTQNQGIKIATNDIFAFLKLFLIFPCALKLPIKFNRNKGFVI